MGRIVSQQELADLFEFSAKSISLWQRDGLPILLETENGLANQYDTAAVHRWLMARELAKVKGESEKDRLARLQGDKIEMELAIARRELVPIKEIDPAWAGVTTSIRQALLSLPARTAPLLAQMDGVDKIRDLLDEMIAETLQKLADDGQRSIDGIAEADVGTARAPAADLAVAMG